VAAAGPVVRRLSRLKQAADLSGSPLLQAALARFAAGGDLERHAVAIRRAYGERRKRLVAALGRHMPEGVSWTDPQGGLSLLVTLPEGLDTSTLLEEAARDGVLYSPGRLFFLGDGARHLRLGFGSVPEADLEEGVKRLAGVVRGALARNPRPGSRGNRLVAPPV
jgi:DNA-binding transcriptional MocR family regulator